MKQSWIVAIVAGALCLGGWAALSHAKAAAAPKGDLKADEVKVAQLTEQIKEVDEALARERANYEKEVGPMTKGSDESKAAQARHVAKVKELQAKKYELWKQKDAVDGAKRMGEAEVKARIADVDKEMAAEREHYDKTIAKLGKGTDAAQDEEDRHREKINVLKGRKAHLEEHLKEVEHEVKKTVIPAADLKTKIADVDKQVAEENDRHARRIAEINQIKQGIFVQLNAKPGPQGDAKNALIHRMQEQDGIIGEEHKQHQAMIADLFARKARLERLAAGAK